MKLGFIGLGSMGSCMARNLLKAGHELTVYNRTREKADPLASEGARIAANPAEACEGEAAITMLADDAAVESVVFGERGILTASTLGLIHVSMSTISTALSRRLGAAHADHAQSYVAAPVFGRPEAAAAAKLIVVAAGKPESVEHCRPALEALGQKVFNAGPDAEKANLIKVSGNFTLASMLETLGEVFAVLRKSGVDPKLFLEIVNGNLFRSPVYEGYGSAMAVGRFEPAGFKLRLGLKDVKLALAAAEEVTAPMPLGSLLRDHFLSGVARGYGDIDWCGVARVIAEDAGLKHE
jgi:3-hydroxyisobutyrate dehydrogenase-like beta-hydroxyacid dehydrogenase